MVDQQYLMGKRILAVDDEDDVLATIKDQLEGCDVTLAGDYESAAKLLECERFDLVILDVMGVRGFDLLDITRDLKIPAVMLTAHALKADVFQRSIDEGAVSFLPKDELYRLTERVEEILRALAERESHWPTVARTLGPRFRRIWGSVWDKMRFPTDKEPER